MLKDVTTESYQANCQRGTALEENKSPLVNNACEESPVQYVWEGGVKQNYSCFFTAITENVYLIDT